MVFVGFFFSLISFNNFLLKIDFVWDMLLLSILCCFFSASIFLFYIVFELSLIPMLLIIIILGIQPERLIASAFFFIYTITVSLPFLFLIVRVLENYFFFSPIVSVSGLIIVLIIPFLVKLPLYGVHFWLPKAHVEARVRGSMLLAGLLLKLGRFGLLRLFWFLYFGLRFFLKMKTLILLMVLCSRIVTFIQSDSKKMVAYSRVAHMTFIVVSIFIGIKYMIIGIVVRSLSHC
jgi:NADH-ubiquinone oxidoreductase chain 4